MIAFSDWHIAVDGELFARQYDNLTRELRVEGPVPEGWDWALLVRVEDNFNVRTLLRNNLVFTFQRVKNFYIFGIITINFINYLTF